MPHEPTMGRFINPMELAKEAVRSFKREDESMEVLRQAMEDAGAIGLGGDVPAEEAAALKAYWDDFHYDTGDMDDHFGVGNGTTSFG